MKKLGEMIAELVKELEDREKRQDEALQKSRAFVRECSKAIKFVHSGELHEAEKIVASLDGQLSGLSESAKGFQNIMHIAFQEYVEVKCLLALLERKELPSHAALGTDAITFLNGLVDCTGELRRALQLALREGKKQDAEYFFKTMNEVYDNLMVLRFSPSLVGNLRRKQDVLRAQIEAARSELLRAA